MRLERSRAKHFDLEEAALLFSTYAICVAIIWLWLHLPIPACPFHALTGFPCLTCGATRAMQFLLHGELRSAFLMNPLFFMLLIGLALFDAYAGVVICFRKPRMRLQAISRSEAALIRVSVVVLLLLNWAYLLLAQPRNSLL